MNGAAPAPSTGCSFLRLPATMNLRHPRFIRPALGLVCAVTLVTVAACNGDACFGVDVCFNDNTQTVALSGTASTGGALASASVTVSCAQGSATTLTDGGGNYRVAVNAALPCVITVASGGTSLHSLAYAGLAVLVVRALAGGLPRRIGAGIVASAMLITTAYGVTDEVHQLFVAGRSAEVYDLVSDAVGAFAGTIVCYAWGIISTSSRDDL